MFVFPFRKNEIVRLHGVISHKACVTQQSVFERTWDKTESFFWRTGIVLEYASITDDKKKKHLSRLAGSTNKIGVLVSTCVCRHARALPVAVLPVIMAQVCTCVCLPACSLVLW